MCTAYVNLAQKFCQVAQHRHECRPVTTRQRCDRTLIVDVLVVGPDKPAPQFVQFRVRD